MLAGRRAEDRSEGKKAGVGEAEGEKGLLDAQRLRVAGWVACPPARRPVYSFDRGRKGGRVGPFPRRLLLLLLIADCSRREREGVRAEVEEATGRRLALCLPA